MTDHHFAILRALADPGADPPGLPRLGRADRAAIQAAVEEIEDLLERLARKVMACEDCGEPYARFPLDVVLPDDQWSAIMGRANGGGILCAACIVGRGAKLPGVTVAKLRFE